MKRFLSRLFFHKWVPPDTSSGFTLVEMLIAMMLTAMIVGVLFRTWDIVISSERNIQKVIGEKEEDRIAYSIIDNDFSTILTERGKDSRMPKISTMEIVPSDTFYEQINEKKTKEKDPDQVLLSFASGHSINGTERFVQNTCIEYRLKKSGAMWNNIVRRERKFCGVDGNFPWHEAVLVRRVKTARVEFVLPTGSVVTDFETLETNPYSVRLVFLREGQEKDEILEVPVFRQVHEIGWPE